MQLSALELEEILILVDSHNGGRLRLSDAHNVVMTEVVLTRQT